MTTTPDTSQAARRHTVLACFEAAPPVRSHLAPARPHHGSDEPAQPRHIPAVPPIRSRCTPAALSARFHRAPAGLLARLHPAPVGPARSFHSSAARHTPVAQPAHVHPTPACSSPGAPTGPAAPIRPTPATPPAHPRDTREAA